MSPLRFTASGWLESVRSSEISLACKGTALELSKYLDTEGKCSSSVQELARVLTASPRTLQRHKRALIGADLLQDCPGFAVSGEYAIFDSAQVFTVKNGAAPPKMAGLTIIDLDWTIGLEGAQKYLLEIPPHYRPELSSAAALNPDGWTQLQRAWSFVRADAFPFQRWGSIVAGFLDEKSIGRFVETAHKTDNPNRAYFRAVLNRIVRTQHNTRSNVSRTAHKRSSANTHTKQRSDVSDVLSGVW